MSREFAGDAEKRTLCYALTERVASLTISWSPEKPRPNVE